MPNPGATSIRQLEMLRFLGKCIGYAIRSHIKLALNLPRLFWALLCHQTVTWEMLLECFGKDVMESWRRAICVCVEKVNENDAIVTGMDDGGFATIRRLLRSAQGLAPAKDPAWRTREQQGDPKNIISDDADDYFEDLTLDFGFVRLDNVAVPFRPPSLGDVTAENYEEYRELSIYHRLHQCDQQYWAPPWPPRRLHCFDQRHWYPR